VSKYITDTSNPGVKNMIARVTDKITAKTTPDQFLDICISVLGELDLSEETYDALMTIVEHTLSVEGSFTSSTESLVTKVFQIVSSSKEFQLC
nr:hypothetical protein [Dehalococcoidia bacterium]